MPLRDRARRLVKQYGPRSVRAPKLSFESWETFPETERVVQVCHPDWRGVRTASYAFRAPVVECDDLALWSDQLVGHIASEAVDVVVIQGWPPGAARFATRLSDVGVRVKCVLHSSPAQHGAEPGEAHVADEVLSLERRGVLAGVGMVKRGVAEAFCAAGYPVEYVPNRAPQTPPIHRQSLGPGLHFGVFASPFWRKNVVTQLLSLGLVAGAVAHVMERPSVDYLASIDIVEHGELPWEEFVVIQGSVDINLYVTLTECHPLSPVESYLMGVPCLTSRTSWLFKEDEELWELTTVDRPDEPAAIAEAAQTLLDSTADAVARARVWIGNADEAAKSTWEAFVR